MIFNRIYGPLPYVEVPIVIYEGGAIGIVIDSEKDVRRFTRITATAWGVGPNEAAFGELAS